MYVDGFGQFVNLTAKIDDVSTTYCMITTVCSPIKAKWQLSLQLRYLLLFLTPPFNGESNSTFLGKFLKS